MFITFSSYQHNCDYNTKNWAIKYILMKNYDTLKV